MPRHSTIARLENIEATMNIHDIAGKILSDMWEYGRLVLILAAILAVYGVVISQRPDEEERASIPLGLVLIGLCTVGVFVLFSFLNIQASNIIALMRAAPLWGCFTVATCIATLVACGLTLYRYSAGLRSDRVGSIFDAPKATTNVVTRSNMLAWLVVALLLTVSIIWLWRMANA